MAVHQALQMHPALRVDGSDVGEGIRRDRAVAEDQVCVRRDRDSGVREGIGVGGKLEQRLDSRVPREFRVVHGIRVAGADEEIAEAYEPAVEERALIDHVGTRAGGVDRGTRSCFVAVVSVVGAGDVHDTVAELVAIPVQDALLVGVAETGSAVEHRIVDACGSGSAAEDAVDSAQQQEFALGGLGEIP